MDYCLEAAVIQASLDICSCRKSHTDIYKSHTKLFSIPPGDKLTLISKLCSVPGGGGGGVPERATPFSLHPPTSGAVCEGGHHVPSPLCHCPAVLLPRALKRAVSPGAVRVEGEHLLQVLEHVVEEPRAEAALLRPPLVRVGGVPVSLEVALKVSLLVGLIVEVEVGVEVVLVSMLLPESVEVFKDVVEVKGLVVLVEVVVAAASSVGPF